MSSFVELKDGHVPVKCASRLGYWTCEEFQKFTLVAHVVLRGLVTDADQHLWFLIACMSQLVFNESKGGWDCNDVTMFEKLAVRYNVLVEESLGLRQCVVTGHNLIHLTDDIRQFGAPDNFWCYTFERAVKRFVHQSTNKKHIECTFARAEERRELYCCLKQIQRSSAAGRTDRQDTTEVCTL